MVQSLNRVFLKTQDSLNMFVFQAHDMYMYSTISKQVLKACCFFFLHKGAFHNSVLVPIFPPQKIQCIYVEQQLF